MKSLRILLLFTRYCHAVLCPELYAGKGLLAVDVKLSILTRSPYCV